VSGGECKRSGRSCGLMTRQVCDSALGRADGCYGFSMLKVNKTAAGASVNVAGSTEESKMSDD